MPYHHAANTRAMPMTAEERRAFNLMPPWQRMSPEKISPSGLPSPKLKSSTKQFFSVCSGALKVGSRDFCAAMINSQPTVFGMISQYSISLTSFWQAKHLAVGIPQQIS